MVLPVSEAVANERNRMYYVIAFAKVTVDKTGIELQDTYFGGITEDETEAHEMAKECVNRIKGGTILTKVIQTKEKNVLIALSEAIKKFDITTLQMQEAERIISRTQERK